MGFWALLIGVDLYGGKDDLQGSVQDVAAMRQYLESHPKQFCIKTLTATVPRPGSSSPSTSPPNRQMPVETDGASWPTKENVLTALKKILMEAASGDEIVLYFSGHGTRLPETSAATGGSIPALQYLALVLFEESAGQSYLHGQTLAHCLAAMWQRGLYVTVILDCCHSGSVRRSGGDYITRELAYDPLLDSISPAEAEWDVIDEEVRGARIAATNVIANPDGYAILTACGPHEIADEFKNHTTGHWTGVFTCKLLEALGEIRRLRSQVTFLSLFEHLRARFQADRPQQTPRRFGNGIFSLLEATSKQFPESLSIFRRGHEDRWLLNGGTAQHVRVGDKYALFDPFLDEPEPTVMVEVSTVNDFESEIVQIPGDRSSLGRVRDGWRAQPLPTNRPDRKISIQLGDSVQGFEDDHPWLDFQRNDAPYDFKVSLSEAKDYYFILDDKAERVHTLPVIPANEDAHAAILGVLTHVAKFKYIERLENKKSNKSFESKFSIVPSASEVMHDAMWRLEVTKLGGNDTPLYLSLLDLDPFWGISNMLVATGEDWSRQMQSECSSESMDILMSFPKEMREYGQTQCRDIFKIFITNKPIAFPTLVLPRIDSDSYRSEDDTDAELARFLAVLEFQDLHRGDAEELWTTRSYTVTTHIAN